MPLNQLYANPYQPSFNLQDWQQQNSLPNMTGGMARTGVSGGPAAVGGGGRTGVYGAPASVGGGATTTGGGAGLAGGGNYWTPERMANAQPARANPLQSYGGWQQANQTYSAPGLLGGTGVTGQSQAPVGQGLGAYGNLGNYLNRFGFGGGGLGMYGQAANPYAGLGTQFGGGGMGGMYGQAANPYAGLGTQFGGGGMGGMYGQASNPYFGAGNRLGGGGFYGQASNPYAGMGNQLGNYLMR